MKENVLVQKSIEFSIHAIHYYRWLMSEKREYVLSKQLIRSATSIGANIHEANFGVSKPDFIAKMQIALKETSETEYWLILLKNTELLPPAFISLQAECSELKALLISTLKTAKQNE